MDLSDFTRRRVFEQPYSKTRREIGPQSILWSLLFGPFYYWRQGALIEAVLVAIFTLAILFVDDDSSMIGPAALSTLITLALLASVILAPVILAASYRRRGWVEVDDDGR
jgi:glycerol uptake facilitator-like aquaporin